MKAYIAMYIGKDMCFNVKTMLRMRALGQHLLLKAHVTVKQACSHTV